MHPDQLAIIYVKQLESSAADGKVVNRCPGIRLPQGVACRLLFQSRAECGLRDSYRSWLFIEGSADVTSLTASGLASETRTGSDWV